MNNISLKKLFGAGALAVTLLSTSVAYSSHHFEGAAYLSDTRLAQVDNFIFPSSRPGHTAIVMMVNYDPKAGENNTFNPDGVYNMHFANGLDLANGKTLSFIFDGNSYEVFLQNDPNPAPGVVGTKIGEGVIGQAGTLSGDIRSYADVVRDPFYGNAIGLEAFRAQNLKGEYDEGVWQAAGNKNVFADRKVGSLVLEVPNEMLGEKVYAFFSTSVKSDDGYKQVNYSALPLMSHLMMFDDSLLRMAHDASRPTEEHSVTMRPLVSARVTRAAVLSGGNPNPVKYGDETAAMLFPDVIPYVIGTPTVFTVERINGRSFDDDVMSVMLSLLLGKTTDQAMTNTHNYTRDFPYVMAIEP